MSALEAYLDARGEKRFHPDQLRDDHGRWTGGGKPPITRVPNTAQEFRLFPSALPHAIAEEVANAVTGPADEPPPGSEHPHSIVRTTPPPSEIARAYWAARGIPPVGVERRSRIVTPAH